MITKKVKPYKVIVLPDIHVPVADKRALAVVEKYMADETFDEWIQLGDFMDFGHISSFNKTALRKIEGESIQADYDEGNKLLDRHQKIIRKNNKKAKFVICEGNHSHRIERYIDEHPQLRGILEVEKGLNLKERKIKWVRNWSEGEVYELGNVLFLHGAFVSQNHIKKMLDVYGTSGKSVVYGHVHSVESASKVCFGSDTDILSQSLGCLCELDQEYMRGKPSNWTLAFGVFYFYPSGKFNHYVVRLNDYSFIAPNGKYYS